MSRTDFRRSLLFGAVALACHAAHADVITDWNIAGLAATELMTAQAQNRVLAMTHAAMFDAVNAITRSHTPFMIQPNAPAGSSVDAAAATAAHDVLVAALPVHKTTLDAALDAALAKVSDPAAKQGGVATGRQVAERYGAARTGDGSERKPDYKPGKAAGSWQPTAPHNLPFASVIWADVKPWVLSSATEVSAAGPPALDSAQYATDLDEVRRLGARNSKERTGDQTAAAIFSTLSPSALWGAAARAAAAAKGTGVVENARIFALMQIAAADATTVGWVIKRQYATWRPIAAIRQSVKDADPSWEPLLNTPAHPDYVSGHCIVSGAAAQVLRLAFGGEGAPFTATYGGPAIGLTRSFSGFTQAETEIGDARVWAGIHTRTADDHGGVVGRKIGELVVQRAMKPLGAAGKS